MMDTLLVELSDSQMDQLSGLFGELKDKGAVCAQIYVDATMRVRLLDPEITMKVQQAIGLVEPGTSFHVYGRDAHFAQCLAGKQVSAGGAIEVPSE